jgi:hypothetical protein
MELAVTEALGPKLLPRPISPNPKPRSGGVSLFYKNGSERSLGAQGLLILQLINNRADLGLPKSQP